MQKEHIKIDQHGAKTAYGLFLKKLYKLFNKVIFCGLKENQQSDIEAQRFVLVINLYSFVGTFYLLLFALDSLLDEHWKLSGILGLSALFAVSNSIYLQRSGNYKRSGDLIVVITTLLFFYLNITGGVENTGPLWSYTLPPLVFFVFGLTRGSLILSGFILASSYIMFFPVYDLFNAGYTYTFKVRYLSTFLGVCFISSICEYSRYHSYNLLRELQKNIQREANTDDLTGLYNRRYMYQQIEKISQKIKRYNRPCSILLCDLDHFKSINDNYGHSCGDQVLIETARRMQECIRNEDIAARWGGEEFLLILPETEGDAANQVAEKLRTKLCNHSISCSKENLTVSMSIGVLEVNQLMNIEDILNNVDDALYAAKRNGRNCTKVFSENMATF